MGQNEQMDLNNVTTNPKQNEKDKSKKPKHILTESVYQEQKELLQSYGYVNSNKELMVIDTETVCSNKIPISKFPV
jgi:hypothetical protein